MLFNENKQKFTILVRVRPSIPIDHQLYTPGQLSSSLQTLTNTPSLITIQRKNNQQKTFKFSQVFSPGSQHELYSKSEHLTDAIFEGYNSTFLAYGQTGTGKTHTVFGTGSAITSTTSTSNKLQQNIEQQGYFYKAGRDIFTKIKQKMNQRQFAVRISFVQFYLDNIYDLIANDSKKLQLKQNADNGIYIKDLTEVPVKSENDLFDCVRQAIKLRKTQQTSINKRSSRSHAVLQITLLQRWIQNKQTKYLKGSLKIVDLAGSQRVSKTQSNGNRLQQAKRINKEITTLGKCINMLAISQKQGRLITNSSSNSSNDITTKFNFNKSYIPFRDAKITRFLSDALQGRSKITLCVCVSKYFVHVEETFSSLLFASQASTLKVQTKKNEIYTMGGLVQKSRTMTPVKGNQNSKSEIKGMYTPRRNSKQFPYQNQRSNGMNYTDNRSQKSSTKLSSMGSKQQQMKQILLKKFRSELSDIDHYLKHKQIQNSELMTPQMMRQNLVEMNKIFDMYRNTVQLSNQYDDK